MFLVGYGALAAIVLVLVTSARRVLRSTGEGPAGDLSTHPHDVAYLNGGRELAVISALTALRLRDAIRSTRGTAQAVPGVALVADDLECAVYRALMTPRNRRSLRGDPGVAAALDRAADR